MGVLARIGGVVRNRAKAGFPLVRRAAEALLARGSVTPPVTRTVNGQTVLVEPERVVPKGVLRSRSVVSALIAVAFGLSDVFGWNLGLTEGQAQQVYSVVAPVFASLAAWFRIVAHMPTRGPTM